MDERRLKETIVHLPAVNPAYPGQAAGWSRTKLRALWAGRRLPTTAAERWFCRQQANWPQVARRVPAAAGAVNRLSSSSIWSHRRPVTPASVELWYCGQWPPGPYCVVVGPRRPSQYAVTLTEQLISRLAPAVTIVSGLAFGIDAVALRTAQRHGGRAVAVVPTGLKDIYPRSHQALARELIAAGGAVCSEYLFTLAVGRLHFVYRNRLLVMLADLVFLPEAAPKSGSLATALMAVEAGVTVAALPGDITRATAAGTNRLIQEGAQVITTADELAALLKVRLTPQLAAPELTQLLHHLTAGEATVDELVESLHSPPAVVSRHLLLACQQGIIRQQPDGRWTIR